MQCDEFESRLQSVLDERARPEDDPNLQAHAVFCDRCGSLLQTQQTLFGMLPACSAGNRSLGSQFSARVVDRVARVRASRGLSPWPLVSAALIALAATWLAFFLGPQSPQPAHTESGPTVAETRPQPTAPRPAAPQPGHMGQPLVALTLDAGAAEQYRRFHELLVRFSETPFEELQSVDQIAGSFRPIATTLNVAFDALRRSLPGSHAREEST